MNPIQDQEYCDETQNRRSFIGINTSTRNPVDKRHRSASRVLTYSDIFNDCSGKRVCFCHVHATLDISSLVGSSAALSLLSDFKMRPCISLRGSVRPLVRLSAVRLSINLLVLQSMTPPEKLHFSILIGHSEIMQ